VPATQSPARYGATSKRSFLPTPKLLRQWYPTQQAAGLLCVSPRTLHRRIKQQHWIEGRHYRWVTRSVRPVLEFHISAVVNLMDQRGW
jgi:hypothetical protein